MQKLIKDIVHGYISLDEDLIDVINSAEFQRLKSVRQTSYNSLYPSSLHDRFTHSLGVYKLGKIAFEHLKENVSNDYSDKNIPEEFWKQAQKIFLLACLLHDIGHSPFSHTGEYFYLNKRSKSSSVYLYDELSRVVNKTDFAVQFKESIQNKSVAKPHEIMSSIIGIKKWLADKTEDQKELFARMIIGLQYKNSSDIQIGIYNALICLLNSSVIDIDKLDYLIRDKLMTGFEGVSIDVERLLASVCLVNQKVLGKEKYHLGYYKNAISVIENAVIAHDSEKKWIQAHAVVAYDSFLVQQCIKAINSYYCKGTNSSIFCEEALGYEGISIQNNTIRLLSDADIMFLAKQIPRDEPQREYVDEYFNRSIRKKAVWKSESEFDLMLRELGDNDRSVFAEWMEALVEDFKTGADSFDHCVIINKNTLSAIEKDYNRKMEDDEVPSEEKDVACEAFQSAKQKIDVFKTFAQSNDINCNFVITWSKRFSSNVEKFKHDEILIKYKNFDHPKAIGDVISTYSLNQQSVISQLPNIYYIYYNRPSDSTLSPSKFIKQFVDLIKES